MSTLTKVFAILLALFSIAFSLVTVAVVAQTADWRALAEERMQEVRIADTAHKNLIATNAAELASARDVMNDLTARIKQLEADLLSAKNDASSLRSELAQAVADKTSKEAQNRALLAQLQASEAERGEYRTQRDQLEDKLVDTSQRNMDLNERVNEQTAVIAVLQAEKRQLEQQVNILKNESETLAGRGRTLSTGSTMEAAHGLAMPGVKASGPVSATPIRGHVTELDGNIVTLSVGSADGVKKHMLFVIHRAGDYVGDIRIEEVAPNQSAGRLVQSRVAPSVGDQVTDAARLSSSAP